MRHARGELVEGDNFVERWVGHNARDELRVHGVPRAFGDHMSQKRLADETGDGGRSRRRDVDAAVRQVIGGAVDASEVIDLFAAVGLQSMPHGANPVACRAFGGNNERD